MIYKAKYLPTGQFYKATSAGVKGKQNLSTKGKVYSNGKPQRRWLKYIFIDGKSIETQASDWEIIKYELTEVGKEPLK